MNNPSSHTFAVLAYKQSPYLEDCVQSLLRQTVKSEILVTTSTPSPFLNDICMKYGIPLLVNAERGGISADWSFAFRNCKTRYLTLAHQDDLYSDEYTRLCVAGAQAAKTDLVTFSDYSELSGGILRGWSVRLAVKRAMLSLFYSLGSSLSSPQAKKMLLFFGNPVCCPTAMYNVGNIGQFEFSPAFSMDLDWEAMLRLAAREGAFVYVKHKLLIRRLHKDSETVAALASDKRRREDLLIFSKVWPRVPARVLSWLYSANYRLEK